MTELNKTQKAAAYNNANRRAGEVEELIGRLRKCSDKLPYDSAEYRLLEQAIGALRDAKEI